jgi:hypothetical protein
MNVRYGDNVKFNGKILEVVGIEHNQLTLIDNDTNEAVLIEVELIEIIVNGKIISTMVMDWGAL